MYWCCRMIIGALIKEESVDASSVCLFSTVSLSCVGIAARVFIVPSSGICNKKYKVTLFFHGKSPFE